MVAADPELVHGANFSKSKNVPIAVIGMACVFPGAPDVDTFWALLEQGQCAVKAVPPNRWDVSNLPESAARFAGFIDDADCFDPAFFGISPKEAAALDPRQRLSLQVAWQALEDAGIAPDGLRESRLGVFIGAVNGEFLGNFSRTDEVEPHMGVGASNAVIANRISHFFGVRGPSMSIDTACSSSLIAVHQACRCLQTGDADMVLAGGVSLMLRADSSVALGKGNMLAPDGLCKTFDASANGYGRGEGCGLVLLKRLDDAIAAGDRIHAVIRGSASNHDGVSNGITAPNGQAQEKLIQDALADAGMHPGDIQYVEAHGTGTLLGDPTEARALGRTLGKSQRARPVLLGSVKTNIGHLEAAAGIAGLIKLILALKHKKLPASLHFSQANPHINFTQLGLSVVDQKQDWLPGNSGEVRVGSVSAFGFGGANCHVVVQESPKTNSPFGQERKSNAPQLFTLSAASSDALQLLAQRSLEKLRRDAESAFNFVAICALSRQGRSPLRHRLNIVVRNMPELLVKLQAFLDGRHETDAVVGIAARRPPRIAFLCPGQGAQRAGMAAGLLTFPPFREVAEEADHILPWSMSQLLSSADAKIDLTAYTQPALLVVGVGLARLLATYGVRPHVLAGHSLGEYTAAVIAGGLNFSDALRLVALRGKLMSDLNSAGGMMAVRANEETLHPYLACFPE
ncbi:MAG: type I polyketide synthase, partial [Burkholderiales bacterium]|nr:type I polyketide synthase [Burkholderiales bacterium]